MEQIIGGALSDLMLKNRKDSPGGPFGTEASGSQSSSPISPMTVPSSSPRERGVDHERLGTKHDHQVESEPRYLGAYNRFEKKTPGKECGQNIGVKAGVGSGSMWE